MIESEYHMALRVAEAEWVRGLLKEFTGGTFPGLDGWRQLHETGEMPEEFQASAEPEGPQGPEKPEGGEAPGN